MGGKALQYVAAQIEKAGREGNLEIAADLYPEMKNQLKALQKAVEKYKH